MFGTDPDQMERRLTEWTQRFSAKADQFHAMRTRVEQVRVTESSTDGAVRVTVDSTGALTGLTLTDRISDLSPPELAAQVMRCLRRAQQQLAPRVQEAMQATADDEGVLVESVVSRYRQRFGEDLSQHTQSPHRHRRPAPPEDDEYFANQGYLR